MKNYIAATAAALALVAALPGAAVGQPRPIATGADLARLCRGEAPGDPSRCMNFIRGVIARSQEESGPRALFCMPEDTRMLEVLVEYSAYMSSHRAAARMNSAQSVLVALAAHWPCHRAS